MLLPASCLRQATGVLQATCSSSCSSCSSQLAMGLACLVAWTPLTLLLLLLLLLAVAAASNWA
jgi:hypothetical protein